MVESTAVVVMDKTLRLDEIGERYGALRLVRPAADQQMLQSLQRYGQMSPVVVCRDFNEGYELIDGFKRLRASRKLGSIDALNARVLELGDRAAKAAVLCLNWVSRSVSDLEEGWVVQSLCRQDGLTQVEAGALLGKDKSWVCRRLSLVERLCEEVQSQIRLGLISGTVGRELARLPRGNQQRVVAAVNAHRLGSREVGGVVDLLLGSSQEQHEHILSNPLQALAEQGKCQRPPRDKRLSDKGNRVLRDLYHMERACLRVASSVGLKGLSSLRQGDLLVLAQPMGRGQRASRQAGKVLDDALTAAQGATDG